MKNTIDLEIIMPVYNEEGGIESTILSFYKEIGGKIRFRFIISEDGSTDGTKSILARLSRKVPMVILSKNERLGYSKGVLRALRFSRAPYVCCIDSDGQYDAKDFWTLWNARHASDVVTGYRKRRVDTTLRIILSRIFYLCFFPLFPKNIHDPSCSFILLHRSVVDALIPVLGLTNEGFWWEFMARVRQSQFSVREYVIYHKQRISGNSQIYSAWSIPIIGIRHGIAMLRVMLSPNAIAQR